jgi:hypothetical protein
MELERWHDFFVLVGTAGATLVALLFVAVSIGVGFLTDGRQAATRAFFSSVVVHFSAIFFVAAIGLVPGHREPFIATMVGGAAIVGGGVAIFTTVELIRHDWTKYLQDHFGYGLLPVICYIGMLVSAWMVYTDRPEAMDVLAGSLLVLMMVNIRNAWDLMLSMVRRHSNEKKKR